MQTFILGLLILAAGYLFYSKYIDGLFAPNNEKTPAESSYDGVDFVPLAASKNALIHLLNIAGLGPILGVIQGILFGPIAFILIPLGCIFAGGVHDYFAGMMSMRNGGLQITGLIRKYLGQPAFKIFTVIISVMFLLVASVFVYTSGDIFTERFFGVKDFVLSNPLVLGTYFVILSYFVIAALFPINKIIGRFYPFLGLMLIIGTALIVLGFFIKGVHLQNFSFEHYNMHPENLPLIPVFFITVSCGLLSGFHSTQAAIVSRTIQSELEGKRIFYGMMCVESLIAMIWAAAAMDVYSFNLVPENMIGTANVINIISDKFVPFNLAFVVSAAVIILPVTSGDTALRAFRTTIADTLKIEQKTLANRLIIVIPIVLCVLGILAWAKLNSGSFSIIWRYFNFFNQLIAAPVLLCAAVYLAKEKKNFLPALIPALFYVFITSAFIFSEKIGIGLPLINAEIIAALITVLVLIYVLRIMKRGA